MSDIFSYGCGGEDLFEADLSINQYLQIPVPADHLLSLGMGYMNDNHMASWPLIKVPLTHL